MAIVTVKFLGQHVDVREEADEEIRQRGFVRVLREVDSQGVTFGAANGAGDAVFGGIPVLQQRISWLEFIGGNFQMRAMNAGTIVEFRGNSRIFQSPLEYFAIGTAAKECNGNFVHALIYARRSGIHVGWEPYGVKKGNIEHPTSNAEHRTEHRVGKG